MEADTEQYKNRDQHISLRKIPDHVQDIRLDGTPITWTTKDTSGKYLGLHFDTQLTWNTHVNKSLNKAYPRLTQLYPLINRNTPLKHDCNTLL